MKKILLFIFTVLLLTACRDDYYEGDERIIIEGKVLYNNLPLTNAEVRVYPVYNATPNSGIISEINYNNPENNANYYSDNGNTISKTYTNNSGIISLSIPRNINTSVYAIKISKGYDSKVYGYISHYNTINYYVNLGTLNY